MIIYLARHGETEWNRLERWQGQTDIELNDAGRAQAVDLAERLRHAGVTRVHASDLHRARETGEIVARRLGVRFAGTDPRLRERRYGCFEGLTGAECQERHPEAWRRFLRNREDLDGGEPYAGLVARVQEALLAIASVDDGPAVVISHGGAIRALVATITGQPAPPMANGGMHVLLASAHSIVIAKPPAIAI